MRKSASEQRVHQIAALPWRKRGDDIQVMLITSRETRRWVIAKGNPMLELSDELAAAQEAYEEAGVQGVISTKAVGKFDYDKRLKDGQMMPCTVDVYPLEVLIQLGSWPELDQRKRQWMTQADAAERVDEPELADLIRTFTPARI